MTVAKPNGTHREPLIPPSPPPATIEALVDIDEAARLLQLTSDDVNKLTRRSLQHPIPYFKVGRRKRFRPSQLMTWQDIEQKRQKTGLKVAG